MLIFANHYYNFGFNVTHISSKRNARHRLDEQILKSPSHDWETFIKRRQSLIELHSLDWQNASGLGIVLGYDNLRALDIDECSDLNLLKSFLSILNLPKDYQWVVKSGSNNGFHIIFYADQHRYPTEPGKVKAFKPNKFYDGLFKHIELRWIGHLVAPPSKHLSMLQYEFISQSYPMAKPSSIGLANIESLINNYCSSKSENTVDISDVHINAEDTFLEKIINYDNLNIQTSGVFIDNEENSSDLPVISGEKLNILFDDPEDLSGVYIDNKLADFEEPYYLFFDTETTGKPINYDAPVTNVHNWPRLVQIAYISYDKNGNEISSNEFIVKPYGYNIPKEASNIHGITTNFADKNGKSLASILAVLHKEIDKAICIVGHNVNFDEKVLGAEFIRNNMENILRDKFKICTMEMTTDFCAISGYNGYKWPKLSELHYKLFNSTYTNMHRADSDIRATAKCFWELKRIGII